MSSGDSWLLPTLVTLGSLGTMVCCPLEEKLGVDSVDIVVSDDGTRYSEESR